MLWLIIFTTLSTSGGGSPAVSTTTAHVAQEVTCRTIERDFTYQRVVGGVTVIGRARCYYDGADVAVPERQ
jgi:hypothetical protein